MKATEDDTKGWKDIRALRLEYLLVTSKMAIPLKAIQRSNAIAVKIPMTFFTEPGQIILNFA